MPAAPPPDRPGEAAVSSLSPQDIREQLSASREQLEVILSGVADGITVQDPRGKLLYANDAAATLIGFETAAELLATPIPELMKRFEVIGEDGKPLPIEDLPGRRALLGERVEGVLLGYRIVDVGEERWSLVSATPVLDARGQVRFAINIFRDVTERRRTEQALRFLAQAGELLSSSLDVDSTLTTLTGLLVPAVADWCIVDMLEPDGTIRQLAVAHRDPERMELIRELRRRFPPDWTQPHPITRVLATGQPEIASHITERTYPLTAAHDPENRRILETLGLRSHIVVPLVSKGRTLGALSLISGESGRRYGDDDLALVEEIARRAAVAVENAQLYRASEDAARREAEGRARLDTLLTELQHLLRETEEQRERMAFLAEASTVLAGSLNYERTLQAVARLAVPQLADWCAVDVVTDAGEIEHVAVAHVDPEKVELAYEFRRRYPVKLDAPNATAEVIRNGGPLILNDIPDELLVEGAIDVGHLAMMRALEIRSFMILPLIMRGRTIGALTMVNSTPGRGFDEDDLDFAGHIARRAATAVENARLFRERSHIAETLQQSLLPPELPVIPGFQVAASYHPAAEGVDVGGDFYDLFQTGEGRWSIVIGDVCGKGVDAAVLTGLTRYTVRATALQRPESADVITALNDAVLLERGESKFCTVVYANLDTAAGGARLAVTCAGHPAPLLIRAGGAIEPVGEPGTLLGVLERAEVQEVITDLEPGDVVVFYTDGIVERRREDEQFGEERLAELVRGLVDQPAERIAAAVERAVLEFGEGGPRDDMAVLVLKRTA